MEYGRAVKEELSGSSARSYVGGLSGYHRVHASPMMNAAADHVTDLLESFGMDDVKVERYPSDGRRRYWTHVTAVGWDVRSAELRLVEPETRMLARFSETPQSLHTFSRSTPGGGVTAELVDVGKGTSAGDYAGKKVKGKIVLATGRSRPVHSEAVVKRGATGIITDSLTYEFPGVRESSDIPDAHAYQGLWPTSSELKKTKFGFSLSKRQGNELRKLLAAGKTVKLHATVDAEYVKGSYSVVSAFIRGSERPEDEIFIIAHLCHPKPSANDNASGSGLLLEVARTISSLIRSGKIERPKRTIRFLWVPETVGSVAFLSKHPELHDRLIAGINMDMVGEDQTLCRSTLCMDSTPDSIPSYLNDLVFSMMERANTEYDPMVKLGLVSNFRIARTVYSGGSDHTEFNDSTVGAPCVGLTQWPDMFYHTSMDTIDKVSEESLKRVGWVAAVSALTLANADKETVHALAVLTGSEGMKRIAEAVEKATSELLDAKRSSRGRTSHESIAKLMMFHNMRVSQVAAREAKAVRSLRRLDADAGSDSFVEMQASAVVEHGTRELARLNAIEDELVPKQAIARLEKRGVSKAEARAKRIVPKRRVKGTIESDFMFAALGEKRSQWYHEVDSKDASFSKKMYEIVNLMDGERDLCEITESVSAQYGLTDIEDVLRIYMDLKSINLVK